MCFIKQANEILNSSANDAPDCRISEKVPRSCLLKLTVLQIPLGKISIEMKSQF